MSRLELRFVPLLGVLFVVLVVLGFLVAGDTPSHHALGPEIRAAYDDETMHQVAVLFFVLGTVPLLFFAGHVRAVLTDLYPSGRPSANVALAGAGVAATGLVLQALIHAALAEAANTAEFSDQALQSLNALDGWSFYPLAIGVSIFALASGIALVRERSFVARFLAWAAIAVGLLGLFPVVGFFAAILSGLWIVIISLTLSARANTIDRLPENVGPDQPPQIRS